MFHICLYQVALAIKNLSYLSIRIIWTLFLTINSWIYFQELIEYLKYTCPAHLYATSISPPAAQQIISSIKVILGEDGSSRGLAGTLSALCIACVVDWLFYFASIQNNIYKLCILWIELNCFCVGAQKLAKIRENSNFFRSELQKMGFEVLGDNDSPVMPIMLYNPAKIPAFSRECLRQNVRASAFHHLLCSLLITSWISVNVYFFFSALLQVAVVTVAFPATPLLLARARICISASHSREDLTKALQVCILNLISLRLLLEIELIICVISHKYALRNYLSMGSELATTLTCIYCKYIIIINTALCCLIRHRKLKLNSCFLKTHNLVVVTCK